MCPVGITPYEFELRAKKEAERGRLRRLREKEKRAALKVPKAPRSQEIRRTVSGRYVLVRPCTYK